MKNIKKIFPIGLIALLLGLTLSPLVSADFTSLGDDQDNCDTVLPNGLVSRGSGESTQYWYKFSSNAQNWFKNWCETIQSGTLDDKNISYVIETYKISYFYIIAHSLGSSTQFQTKEGNFYTADQLKKDMKNRPPMKFALICCCEGMTDIGPGTLSYEFRKGQLNNTVTIGYTNMKEYKEKGGSMWYALNWQDLLLFHINQGLTIKKSFDIACYSYPAIADYVRFVGDTSLRLKNFTLDKDDTTKIKNNQQIKNFNKPLLSIINWFLEKILSLKKAIFIS